MLCLGKLPEKAFRLTGKNCFDRFMEIPDLISECIFKAVRSGGKGGQHVNKVATKVELYFSITDSNILTQDQKNKLLRTLHTSVNEAGVLRITSDSSRSQVKNKQETIHKLHEIIKVALTPVKKRMRTKVPANAVAKRKQDKKKKSDIKQLRKKPRIE